MTKEEAIKVLSESIHYDSKVPLGKIVEAVRLSIEALSKPPLPSNLDEAAENHMLSITTLAFDERDVILSFKAGAEWMAGQGVTKEAVIGMATEEISINVSQKTLNELDLCPGDKVVVQIRKK